MLALVGQVLDLNRLDAGKLPLRIAHYDIADLLRNIAERFKTWASQQSQTITVVNCDEPFLLWFDLDQFDKCVSNLLSNAIKYSGDNSHIHIQLSNENNEVTIIVRDNGTGISEQAKDKIFERFYQDKTSENMATPGTGIGLALVHEIMIMHHGNARLIDNKGPGCWFVLNLKTGNEHFAPEQIIEPIAFEKSQKNIAFAPYLQIEGDTANSEISTTDSKNDIDITTLLIVDDNIELLNFISLRLSASYKILQASNGLEGYTLACEALPDLIISDVSMPIMTGLELVEKLKLNRTTQTIPVILLTAKATKREVVEGFSVGADDYLTKPFDTSELIMRVNAQINVRKMVRERLVVDPADSDDDELRKGFAKKVRGFINKELVEPTFNVEKLAASLFMSRDTLIRKCKRECGQTPLNLIIQARMEKADLLLRKQTMSISEVAYACGFESLAYFSKSYKKHRGVSPSDV